VRTLLLIVLSFLWNAALTDATPIQTDRETDGFVGPVRSVVIETAKLLPARLQWQQDFRQQAHIVEWLDTPDHVAQFTTAPMQWHGQVVGFVGTLHQRLSERTSVFTIAPWQFVVLRPEKSSQLPKVGEQVLVAGRVEGTAVVELPETGQVLLPDLSVVAIAPIAPPPSWGEWLEEPRVRGQTMTYDAQGKLHDTAFYNEHGMLRWQWQYTYTPQGRIQARTSTDMERGPRWTMRYLYDAAGHLQEKVEVAADQAVARRWHYLYNAQGLLIEETNYDSHGALLWKWRYTYNAQGQRIEESNHTADGTILWKRQYIYGTHKHLTEEHHYDAVSTLLWRRHYTYDTHGNRIEEVLYKGNGTLQSRWRYTYNAYDAYGNWLKRTEAKWVQTAEHADFEPVQVTYRTLLYY
jgi:YD repeat-containing protein